MNIMIVNCSPKKKGGASAFFSRIMRFMLFPKKVITKNIGVYKNYEDIFMNLVNIDAVILSVPLYVDSIPSHVIHFLKQMEQYCIERKFRFMLYVISNSGFVGGKQNKAHLEQYKCWCQRTGIKWGGGLGIGGAVMLNAVFHIIPIWCAIQFITLLIINIIAGRRALDNAMLTGLLHGIVIWMFLCIGMLFYLFVFSLVIKNKKSIKNKYTSIMIPSFIFLVIADLFMVLSALFNGKFIFSLFKKPPEHYMKNTALKELKIDL